MQYSNIKLYNKQLYNKPNCMNMKKNLFYLTSIFMLLGFSACEKEPDMEELDADLVVYTDYDKDADFGEYQTYFLPDSILEAGGHKVSYWKDENALSIINTIAEEMESRGYKRITDPEKKEEASVGVQVSYVAQTTQVITGGYWGGWWDFGFWGPWSGWYYPYPISYSYDTNTLIMEMVNLTAKEENKSKDLPVIWYASASGFQYSGQFNQVLLKDAVKQAFEQSPYIKALY